MVTQKLGFLKWCRDHFPLPFCRDKLSLGVSHVDGATPWDDCPYAKGNANTFVRACAYRVFLASCVEINLGGNPRSLQCPRSAPLVDPSTPGSENPSGNRLPQVLFQSIILWRDPVN